MVSESEEVSLDRGRRWYCVRTKSKCEHIAAAHLRKLGGVEVFCPRLRYQKATRRGKVWFVEALFPGYLLACFNLETSLRAVSGAHQVTTVVRFGEVFPCVGEDAIEALKREVDAEELVTLNEALAPGDQVQVMDGPMMGMSAIVKRLLPAKQRVRILLEILGRAAEVEVERTALLSDKHPRDQLSSK